MTDKREERRSPIELAASFGIGEDPRPDREAKINNVSTSGFCFTSDIKLKVGDEIPLDIELDTVENVIITVKVVWVKEIKKGKYTVGVQIAQKEGPNFDRFMEFYNQQSL